MDVEDVVAAVGQWINAKNKMEIAAFANFIFNY